MRDSSSSQPLTPTLLQATEHELPPPQAWPWLGPQLSPTLNRTCRGLLSTGPTVIFRAAASWPRLWEECGGRSQTVWLEPQRQDFPAV